MTGGDLAHDRRRRLPVRSRCGRADADLLESYAAERIPVAERLLGTTDRAFRVLVSDRWFVGLFRTRELTRILAFAMTRERIRKFAFLTISQTGIRYRDSPLSKTLGELPVGAPQPGDRFPWLRLRFASGGPIEDLFGKLDDTRFNLIVVGQPTQAESDFGLGDLLRTHAIPGDPANDRELARVGIPAPSFYLLRPDGRVGLAGTRLEAAKAARYLP